MGGTAKPSWLSGPPALPRLFCLELFFLVRHPGLEFGWALDSHEAAHAVMTETAQLGAGDLVVAGTIGNEPDGNVHPGDRVLLHPHFVQAEAVNHVLAREVHENRPVDGEIQLVNRSDIVFRVWIGA